MSDYTDWIRAQPCIVTSEVGEHIDPHHIKGYSYVTGSGGSKKGMDYACVPLRHDLHQELHTMGWRSFENKYRVDQLLEAYRFLLTAINENILTIEVNHE